MIATAAQLSSECSDEALLQLSTEIAGYDRYKHRLGLSDAEIDAIDQSPSMVDNIPHAALKKWKSKSIIFDNPSNSTATYGQLVEIAAKIEDKEAIRSIHKACVEHTSELLSILIILSTALSVCYFNRTHNNTVHVIGTALSYNYTCLFPCFLVLSLPNPIVFFHMIDFSVKD